MSTSQNIVVIARDELDAEQIGAVLIQAGFEVQATVSAAMGLRFAAELAPCAVVSDGDMPALNGGWIARLLKSNAGTAAIPLILVTDTDVVTPGADAGICRGFHPQELIATLQQCLALAADALSAQPFMASA